MGNQESLYLCGYDRAIIIALFRFIDWVIALPKTLENSFWNEIKQLEKDQKVQYVTTSERIGIEKGIEKGMVTGELKSKREDVLEALEINLEITVPTEVVDIINQEIDLIRLKKCIEKL